MPSYVTGTERGYFYGRYYTSSNGFWSYAGPIQVWAPSLSTPSASHSNVGTSSATLSWGSITGATSYRYQVTTSTSFSTNSDGTTCYNCVVNSTTSSTSRSLSGLQSSTTYRYRVRAGNATTGQGSYWSSIRSFTTSGPSVSSVSPSTATLGQSTSFTVYGSNLTSGMGFWIADCSGVTELSGGTSTRRYFRCAPSYSTGSKSGTVKTSPGGTTLHNFSVQVSSPSPTVSSVTPSTATLGQLTTFTINGSNLTSGMGFWIADCSGVTELSGGTSTRQYFRCTPSYSAGSKSGTVKTTPGGTTLHNFSVQVSAPAPTVSSVSPSTATLGQLTTFTIHGSNLTSGMGFWIANCDGLTELGGGSASQRYFRCTPRWHLGSMDGVVRDEPDGTLLREFTVQVTTDIVVHEVVPERAMLNTSTDFIIRGEGLPAGMGFWIANCSGVTELSGGTSTERRFRCTPGGSTGTMDGVLKDEPDGATLYPFSVSIVQPATVTNIWPVRAAFGLETIFTIQGSQLPTDLGFFVERCEGVDEVPGGHSGERFFSCVPSYQLGSQTGVVKIAPDGTPLRNFDVEVVNAPTVSDLQPLTALLDQPTTFTVSGSGLLDAMAFWIAYCENVVELSGGTSTQRQFRCTPRLETGPQDGVLKLAEKGNELWTFQVEVTEVSEPAVTSVSPSSATIDEPTTFTIAGSDLPVGLDFTLSQCESPTELSGSSTSRRFRCTPREVGPMAGTVLTADDDLLHSFTVNVTTPSGVIYPDVSDWAQGAADYLVQHGIVVDPGDHHLRGQVPANRAEVATLLYRALGGGQGAADATFEAWYGGVPAPHFADVADPAVWYFRPATFLGSLDFEDGIAVFDPDSCVFRPGDQLDRSWTTKALLSTWDRPPLGSFGGVDRFDDVPTTHPAAGWIYGAQQLGLVGGNDTYRPDESVNREDLFVMLHRILEASANLEGTNVPAPVPTTSDFLRANGCRRIGHDYEQPVLQGVEMPEVEVVTSGLAQVTLGNLEVQAATLEVIIHHIDGGSHVDAEGVEHQARPFCAWEASAGGLRDLDPGGDPPICKVQWIAPAEVSGTDGADAYKVTLHFGDGLGHKIVRTVDLQISQPGIDGEKPSVSWDPVASVPGGQSIELTGTASDPEPEELADHGLLSVTVSFSLDGGESREEIGTAELESDGFWRLHWIAPMFSGPVQLYAVAHNLRGNSAQASTTIELIPTLAVAGIVESSSGGPLENAAVILEGGGSPREVRSDLHGSFRFDQDLQTSVVYRLAVIGPAGQTASSSDFVLSTAQPEVFEILRLDDQAPLTSASPPGGLYSGPQMVELLCSDDLSGCSHTYYTLDGSTPDTGSSIYNGPIELTSGILSFFSVDQAGNVGGVLIETYEQEVECIYSWDFAELQLPAEGGSGEAQLSTAPGCAWNVLTSDAWLSATPTDGVGAATLSVGAAANETASERVGHLEMAGQILTVRQPAPTQPPSVVTGDAVILDSETIRLEATVDANGSSTQGWFEYQDPSGITFQTPAQDVGESRDPVLMTATLPIDGAPAILCGYVYRYKSWAENVLSRVSGNWREIPGPECEPCFALDRDREGSGAIPSALPASSSGCPAGKYRAGAVIELSALADPGWTVMGWSGTDHDESTSETNTLTMPSDDHSVSVQYTEEASTTASHHDAFHAVTYTGDDGDRLWPGSWRETPNDGGSPSWGHVRVITDGDVDHGVSQLRIRRDGMWVERPVDLSGAGEVTWTFDYRRESLLEGHYVAAEVSSDGSAWTEVARMAGPADDAEYQQMSVAIPVESTKIRFANPAGIGMGNENMVFFDNVEVTLDLGPSMRAAVNSLPNTVVTPGGPVTLVVTVENTSPFGTLELTTLEGSLGGEVASTVDGVGTCSVPQSLAVGATYTCQLERQVTGSGGSTVDYALTAAGTVGADPLTALASTTIGVLEDVEANARDTFATVSYAGEDGTVPWTSSWIEAPIDGSQASWGDVRILEDSIVPHAEGPYQAFIRDDQLWLRRKVDLTGFSAAELDFDYRRSNLLPGQRLDIEVSTDGVAFQRLASIEGSEQGTDLSYSRWTPPLDLSPYISDSTWIQFSNLEDLGMGNSNAVYLDNVEIRLQSGSSIAMGMTVDPDTVVEPGGPVTFGVTVTNHSPSGSVELTDLTDDQIGDLNGAGSCLTPRTVLAGDSYVCSYGHTVSGTAGSTITHVVSAVASAGGEILNAGSSASITVEAPGLETLRDELNAVSFHGNDGTVPWSSPWIESISDGGAPYHGHVRVEEDAVGTGPYALRIRRDGLEAKREADLSGFAQASLTFDYRRNNLLAGHHVDVEVSLDGSSWTLLDQLEGPALDQFYQKTVYDLSPWISGSTWIRFHAPAGQGMGNANLIYFDNIEIQLTEPVDGGLGGRDTERLSGNLLSNPSFEEGLGYWQLISPEPLGILPSELAGSASLSRGRMAEIQSTIGDGRYALTQCVRIEPSRQYGFGGETRVESLGVTDPVVSMGVELYGQDGCDGEVLSATGEVLWVGQTEGGWRSTYRGRAEASGKAVSARVWVVVQGEGADGFRVWLDNLSFRMVRQAP